MQIEMLKLDAIKPYEKNPRKNDASVKAVSESIKEFGFKVPIVIDRDNVIVCGHTRYKAAQKLKLSEVPCIKADDLTDEQIKAYRLADNKVGESSEWDLDLLSGELDDILDLDMSKFGFDIAEDVEAKEDDFDVTPPEDPVSREHDIWILGAHRVMCGDSTKPEDLKMLMGGGTSGPLPDGSAV